MIEDGYLGLAFPPLKIETFNQKIGNNKWTILIVCGADFSVHCFRFKVNYKDVNLTKMEEVSQYMTPEPFNSKVINLHHDRVSQTLTCISEFGQIKVYSY